MTLTRCDIASLGPGWNDTMIWYAKAVQALRQMKPATRTSWAYLGAIHGIDPDGWIADGIFSAGDPLPSADEQEHVWNQCQHAGWFFVPWHRGYLHAFEAIVSNTIKCLGGPGDWALPYWNYLNSDDPNARAIPQVFLDVNMPDGTPNPLAKAPRGGTTVLGPQPWLRRDITLACMTYNVYTSTAGTTEFGGGETGFMHFGDQTGALESNPHNLVHVMIGGVGPTPGFMSDPNYAALDPIFWLHHCNIDRLWAAWMEQRQNVQETGQTFTDGPFPRQFTMPDIAGNLQVFTPGDTLPGGALAPAYDNLTAGTGVGAAAPASLPPVAAESDLAMAASSGTGRPAATVIASTQEEVTVGTGTAAATVHFTPEATAVASSPEPQRLFLNLENVRGAAPSGVLTVYVTLPTDGAVPASVPEYVDTVALFGLAKASSSAGAHGGNGLTLALDITELARRLANAAAETLERLEVRIEQEGAVSGEAPITIGRISVYQQPVGA